MYEDLIKRLREESLYKDKATLEIIDSGYDMRTLWEGIGQDE